MTNRFLGITAALSLLISAGASTALALTPSPATIAPTCEKIGSRAEGWYDESGERIEYAQCSGAKAVCKNTGTRSEGWYDSKSGELIAYRVCSGANAFSDVLSTNEFYWPIMNLRDRGIISGYPDGKYKPNITINRAEFTKIVIGAKYSQEEIDQCLTVTTFAQEGIFKDVPWDAWYVKHLCVAVVNGVIGGHDDGTFRPASQINYAEAAKILALTFRTPTPKPVEGTVWYKPYIDGLRLTNALPEGYRSADQLVTRGKMAFMIDALLTYSEEPIPTDQPVVGEGCKVSGCSATICQNEGDEEMMTTCEWRQEYACYEHATCEKQRDGSCGWTPTEQLDACIMDAK